jgi:streptomycin 6-kinase
VPEEIEAGAPRRYLASEVEMAVRLRWPSVGPAWCDQVEGELSQLCERYSAQPVRVMRSRYGLVIEVSANAGPLVFRSSPDPAGGHQARVAIRLAELGVGPVVHEYIETDTVSWLVLERIFPGTPLGDADPSRLDLASIATSLGLLAGQPAPADDLPGLGDWLRQRLLDDSLTDLAPGQSLAPQVERQHALAVLADLEASGIQGLCHGDTSPWNLLLGWDGRTILIDPRGVIGEAAYDIAVVALKTMSVVPSTISIPALTKAANIDPSRVSAWLVVAQAARV